MNIRQLFETAKPLPSTYIPSMNNWLVLNYRLRGLQSLEIVQSMLVYELNYKAREHIINRLLSRYSTLAQKDLHNEIFKSGKYTKAI